MFASTLLAVHLGVSVGHATSCAPQPLRREVRPGDGATDFPTDGRIRVFLEGSWAKALPPLLAAEYRLRGPDGALVPLDAEAAGWVLTLTPKAPLRPDADYVLERVHAWGAGRLLTDVERWTAATRAARGEDVAVQRHAWVQEARFHTGPGPEAREPGPVGVGGAVFHARPGLGEGESIGMKVIVPDDLRPTDMLEVAVGDAGVAWRWPLSPDRLAGTPKIVRPGFGDGGCLVHRVHTDWRPGLTVRARVVSAAGAGTWSPPMALIPPERPPARRPGRPSHEAREAEHQARLVPAARAFVLPAPDAAPVVGAPGPGACPNGLAVASTRVFSDLDWEHEVEVSELHWRGDRGSLVVREGEGGRVRLGLLGPGDAVRWLDLGDTREVGTVRGGPSLGEVVVTSRLADGRLRVWQPAEDGTAAWARTLEVGEAPRPGPVLVGADRVLVGWRPVRAGPFQWAVLDRATGETVGQGQLEDPSGRGLSPVGWDGSRFALLREFYDWGAQGGRGQDLVPRVEAGEGVFLVRIRAEGGGVEQTRLPVARTGAAAAATPEGWVLVSRWFDKGVTWIDRAGHPEAAPTVLPDAGVQNVRDVAVAGSLVVVAGDGPAHQGQVLALDATGALSPPLLLADGAPVVGPELAVTADGFVAAYGVRDPAHRGWVPAVAHLACAAAPSPGPPVRLAE